MMKKLLATLLILINIVTVSASAAYTLDIIYGSFEEEEETNKEPYFKYGSTFVPVEPDAIFLSENMIYFHINGDNKPVPLNGVLMPVNSKKLDITYSSSDETVAKVDSNGIVTSCNKPGSAIITAKCGEVKEECLVRVVVGVESVKITNAPMRLYADKPVTAQLGVEIYPPDADIKDVRWSSSDVSIATVDRTGVVMPCGVGEVTITATTKDGNKTAECKINVDVWENARHSLDYDITYSHYNTTLEDAIIIQSEASPTVFTNDAYPAQITDVEDNIIPHTLIDGYNKYQFLDLSKDNGIDADILNNYLSGKGVLDGMGDVFIDAAKEYGISEVYLAVHACLESGNGTSRLAQGIEYEGETVYNMFGIGAVDSAPIEGGTKYAYSNGWTSVEKAIKGGAQWISKYYINNSQYQQNTLYKMRWNPAFPGEHQYATDVAWATKQSRTLYNMFAAFPTALLSFDYPVYYGEEEIVFE